MSTIQILDQHTINKIAAGEVVERPASVVKELIENSIDAKASAVTIEIKDGGISLIRITDNGVGIPKDEVKTAFLRHTTSKIKDVEDLQTIASLGFRGEALASIAAVSQIEMITKTMNSLTGIRMEVHGGNIVTEQEIGCPEGTTIIMRNLFYNTPARRKFLKKASTEVGYINDIIYSMALGHPEISFKFINNNSVVLHTSGNNELKNTIFHVYGKNLVKDMIPVVVKTEHYQLNGFIGKPQVHRGNRNYENLFINGRYIKSKTIQTAVEDAFKTLLPINKFPVFVLHIKVNPLMIDVNVHPTKMEVRFDNEEDIYHFTYEAVSKALKNEQLIPEVTWDKSKEKTEKPKIVQEKLLEPFELNRNPIIKPEDNMKEQKQPVMAVVEQPVKSSVYPIRNQNQSILKEKEINFNNSDINPEKKGYNTEEKTSDLQQRQAFTKEYKIIGQLFRTYWIVEEQDKMYLIDQHAAHERILYEKLMDQFKNQETVSQTLLQPITFNVSIKEKQIIEDHLDLFNKFGFEIEEFGNDAYAIRALPIIFDKPAESQFILEILDLLQDSALSSAYEAKLEKIASLSCKAAVKAMDEISLIESKSLIERLLELENPYTCPHGRPTIISMSKYELEKKFHRIQ